MTGCGTGTPTLSDEAVAPPGDTTVKICFAGYTFVGKMVVTNLCGEGKIYNDANIGDLVNDSKKAVNDAVSAAKISADKNNIFAGLNISVPSGGGETQGSGDLNLNHYFAFPLVGQGIFGLEVKKGSSTSADPRHFTSGIKGRKTWLLGVRKSDLNALISGIESSSFVLVVLEVMKYRRPAWDVGIDGSDGTRILF